MQGQVKCRETLKQLLESGHETHTRDEVMHLVLNNEQCFQSLMDFFIGKNWHWRYNQRASWSASILAERKPEWFYPYIGEMVEAARSPSHVAVRRNVVRLFQFLEIPEEYEGRVYEMCFGFLNDPSETIAVRVFSMTVLANIAFKYPDMISELEACILSHIEHGSAGFKNRGSKILNKFSTLKKKF